MAGTDTAVIRLSDIQDGQEATCFAALVKKERSTAKNDKPYLRCTFRDKRVSLPTMLWHDSRLYQQAGSWTEGVGYRISVRGEQTSRYGMQIQLFEIRPAVAEDEQDGYDYFDLVESSKYPFGSRLTKIHEFVDKYIGDASLRRLVRRVLDDHADLFQKMPAAQSLHHGFVGGLIEHVWSVTRVSIHLANHYGNYYDELNPPLNKGVIVAAAILHDIGKLRELEFSSVEARYTKEGTLIGHILIGRDMVRDAARDLGDIPLETQLLLDHAILAHHGKAEYGAPKSPMTLEALIVHYADEIDAKINAVAQGLRNSKDDGFTDKIYAVDNRRFYRGIPVELPEDEPVDDTLP